MIQLTFGMFLLVLGSASGIVIFIRAINPPKTEKLSEMPGMFTLWALAIVCCVGGLLVLNILPLSK
jgi:hypothetical protein